MPSVLQMSATECVLSSYKACAIATLPASGGSRLADLILPATRSGFALQFLNSSSPEPDDLACAEHMADVQPDCGHGIEGRGNADIGEIEFADMRRRLRRAQADLR